MKKLKKIFIALLLITFISTVTIDYKTSIADVGSFEDYDSGSSWDSDSSWDSGSSWSSWDDDDYSSSYGGTSHSSGGGSSWGTIITFIIIIAIAYAISSKNKHTPIRPVQSYQPASNFDSEENVERKVKAVDEMFNKEEFLSWTRSLFVKLQEAWTARDWSTIRVFETNELFEQHQKQLQGYIDRKQINVMERICVLSVKLADFKQTGNKDVLTVVLKSRMNDYIIDETTGKIVKGDKTTDRYSTYKLDFIRTTGEKTKPGSIEINTTNCPNCGAPTQITSSGKCEYCGSVITTGEHSWALSNLEKIG